ncbi:TIR domain-containing protein [Shewanella sp. ENK2]|uniref:TIR domain-containing protein n=1 Tax=Shewanella sp. ENK2 TaxID=2775245 RepID=UPI00374A5166
MRKPRVFIGSSVESLHIADGIAENLEYEAEVTIWRNGTFKLSSNALDDLIQKSKNIDFSIFIFSPDDLAVMRSREQYIVRDNVVFELGLFIGSIGKERCYIVKPRGVDLHFPSDLLGINPTDYDPQRSDNDLVSALNYASTQIKREITSKGILSLAVQQQKQQININESLASISDADLLVMGALLESMNEQVTGCPSWSLISELKNIGMSGPKLQLTIIKLERNALIQRTNDVDYNGDEGFFYSLTDYGVDICLKNEEKIESLFSQPKVSWNKPQPQQYK